MAAEEPVRHSPSALHCPPYWERRMLPAGFQEHLNWHFIEEKKTKLSFHYYFMGQHESILLALLKRSCWCSRSYLQYAFFKIKAMKSLCSLDRSTATQEQPCALELSPAAIRWLTRASSQNATTKAAGGSWSLLFCKARALVRPSDSCTSSLWLAQTLTTGRTAEITAADWRTFWVE